jgi:hypothetical protein
VFCRLYYKERAVNLTSLSILKVTLSMVNWRELAHIKTDRKISSTRTREAGQRVDGKAEVSKRPSNIYIMGNSKMISVKGREYSLICLLQN